MPSLAVNLKNTSVLKDILECFAYAISMLDEESINKVLKKAIEKGIVNIEQYKEALSRVEDFSNKVD